MKDRSLWRMTRTDGDIMTVDTLSNCQSHALADNR